MLKKKYFIYLKLKKYLSIIIFRIYIKRINVKEKIFRKLFKNDRIILNISEFTYI